MPCGQPDGRDVFFGTKYFAAPEQYGFSQTDSRTDIFSMGALLCWLLTGDADIRHGIAKLQNKCACQIQVLPTCLH